MKYTVKITQVREGFAEIEAENPQAAVAEANRLYNQEGRELPDMEDARSLYIQLAPSHNREAPDNPEHTGPLTEEEAIAYMKRQGYPNAGRADAEWLLENDGYRQECGIEAVRKNYDLPDVDRWYHLMDVLHVDLSFRAAMFVDNALWEEDLECMEVSKIPDILDTPDQFIKHRLAFLADLYNATGRLDDFALDIVPEQTGECWLVDGNPWGLTPQDVATLIKALNLENELNIAIPHEEPPSLEEEPELPPEAKVYICAGSVKEFLTEGPYETCLDFCNESNWIFRDSNDFVWDLELEDLRELNKGPQAESLDGPTVLANYLVQEAFAELEGYPEWMYSDEEPVLECLRNMFDSLNPEQTAVVRKAAEYVADEIRHGLYGAQHNCYDIMNNDGPYPMDFRSLVDASLSVPELSARWASMKEEYEMSAYGFTNPDGRLSACQMFAHFEELHEPATPEFVQPQPDKENFEALRESLSKAVAIEYKGIVFDNWDISEELGSVWGEMCQDCADKYKDILSEELSDGGCGSCSVMGCHVVGADSDNERHYYVDFKPEHILALSQERLMGRHPEFFTPEGKKTLLLAQVASANERNAARKQAPDQAQKEQGIPNPQK